MSLSTLLYSYCILQNETNFCRVLFFQNKLYFCVAIWDRDQLLARGGLLAITVLAPIGTVRGAQITKIKIVFLIFDF